MKAINKPNLIACCVLFICFIHNISIGDDNSSEYPLEINIKTGKNAALNPTLIWTTKSELTLKDLQSMTIFVFNTDTKKGRTLFLIRDLKKKKVTKEDHTIDLGKHDPGEYEAWVEYMMKKKKVSNKVIFTIE